MSLTTKTNRKLYQLSIYCLILMLTSSILATVCHELGHFLIARILNVDASIHHNYVQYSHNIKDSTSAKIAIAGPVLSLCIGLFIRLLRLQSKTVAGSLFALWFEIFNMLTFLGYLFITPFAHDGDLGRFFDLVRVPNSVRWILSASSIILINAQMCAYAKCFPPPKSIYANLKIAQSTLFAYPIVLFIPIMAVLSLPVVSWTSLLPVIMLPLSFFKIMACYGRLKVHDCSIVINGLSALNILVAILAICLFRILV